MATTVFQEVGERDIPGTFQEESAESDRVCAALR